MVKIPISSTDPKRFFAARRNRLSASFCSK
jgi:hypothetical protein